MTVKLLINGLAIAGVDDPVEAYWSDDEPAERTHSGAAQSFAFVDITYEWVPVPRAMYVLLNAGITALGGKIDTSITGPGRDYDDPDVWVVFPVFDSRGMWPERPKGRLVHHLVTGPGRQGGPTWTVRHVAPARV